MNALPSILDACCGSRMFWYDRSDDRALFIDNRRGTFVIDNGTGDTTRGRSPVVVEPDMLADFTELPFDDGSFHLVVFDPPHIQRPNPSGVIAKRYGTLTGEWREMLSQGFAECFRVLKPNGTLVFKWGESQFRVKDILKLTPEKPLFGHKTSKTTHWCVFMKGAASADTHPQGGDVKQAPFMGSAVPAGQTPDPRSTNPGADNGRS